MLAIVKAENGIPSVKGFIYEAVSFDEKTAIAYLEKDEPDVVIARLNDIEYLKYFRAGIVTNDKVVIQADGLDTATVTAEVHPDLTEITFYHADTNAVISTVPVDPVTHKATLQVTATTPGVIHIRAGEPTITRLNEVIINAT